MKQILEKFSTAEEMNLWLADKDKHYEEIEHKYPADQGYHCTIDTSKREVILTKVELKEENEFVPDEDKCPYCYSTNIDCAGHSLEDDDDKLEMQMMCEDCGKKFVNIYDIDYDRTEKCQW